MHRRQTLHSNGFQPSTSADGRWLAFTSDESGSLEVYVTPAAGGYQYQVSKSGGSNAAWSPDGSWLFYRTGDGVIAAALNCQTTFSVESLRLVFEGNFASFDVLQGERRLLITRTAGEVHLVEF